MKCESKVTASTPASPSTRAVAYYRSSLHDGNSDSISFQQDQVRQWALAHGIEIIHEFCDATLPGCNTDERPAFTEMLNHWIKQRTDFEYILCLDASRLGRFAASDLSVESSDIFQNYKKEVIYTSIDNA